MKTILIYRQIKVTEEKQMRTYLTTLDREMSLTPSPRSDKEVNTDTKLHQRNSLPRPSLDPQACV